jgi:hypothetical protein
MMKMQPTPVPRILVLEDLIIQVNSMVMLPTLLVLISHQLVIHMITMSMDITKIQGHMDVTAVHLVNLICTMPTASVLVKM